MRPGLATARTAPILVGRQVAGWWDQAPRLQPDREPSDPFPPWQERYLDELAAGGRGTLLADDGLGFAGGEARFGAPAFMDGG